MPSDAPAVCTKAPAFDHGRSEKQSVNTHLLNQIGVKTDRGHEHRKTDRLYIRTAEGPDSPPKRVKHGVGEYWKSKLDSRREIK